LIPCLVVTQVQVRDLLEVAAPSSRAAVVDTDHDDAALGEQLVPQVAASAPGVRHGLRAGAAVHVEQRCVPARRIEVGRLDHPAVQRNAVRGLELEELGGLEAELTDALRDGRSEEHTSELQSRENLVCRLLLEKKK